MATLIPVESIVNKIVLLRGEKVLLIETLQSCMMLRPSN